MSKFVVDTSVWFSYFHGRNEEVRTLIETNQIIVSALVLLEIHNILSRKGIDPEPRVAFVRCNAEIIPMDEFIAVLGSKTKQEIRTVEPRFGLMDGMQYATARHLDLPFVTLDKEFSHLPGAEILSS